MDLYFVKLLLSVLFFAPGLVIAAGALLVGLLMVLEKVGVFPKGSIDGGNIIVVADVENPKSGPIVQELIDSLIEKDDRKCLKI